MCLALHLLFLAAYFFFEIAAFGDVIRVIKPSLSGIITNQSFIRAWRPSHNHPVEDSGVLTEYADASNFHPHAVKRSCQLQPFAILIGDRDARREPQDLSLYGGTGGAFANIAVVNNYGRR